MYRTPEEAKQLDCCTKDGKCVAEQCMGWKFKSIFEKKSNYITVHGNRKIPGDTEIVEKKTDKGYCGLVNLTERKHRDEI